MSTKLDIKNFKMHLLRLNYSENFINLVLEKIERSGNSLKLVSPDGHGKSTLIHVIFKYFPNVKIEESHIDFPVFKTLEERKLFISQSQEDGGFLHNFPDIENIIFIQAELDWKKEILTPHY